MSICNKFVYNVRLNIRYLYIHTVFKYFYTHKYRRQQLIRLVAQFYIRVITLTTDTNLMVDRQITDKNVNLNLRVDSFYAEQFKRVYNIKQYAENEIFYMICIMRRF